jgi:hypothetical protein
LRTRDPLPCPETNNEGVEIHLTKASKDTSAAPKIPNPEIPPSASVSHNLSISPQLRRSPRVHDTQDYSVISTTSTYLDINTHGKGVYLDCQGWRGTLSTGQIVFVRLWDGWKFSREECDHEAPVYIHLRDLWGTVIAEFLGSGDWGFCHILLLSFIDVSSHLSSILPDLLMGSVQCYIKLNSTQRFRKT